MSDDARIIGQWLAYLLLGGFGVFFARLVYRELCEARAWGKLERRIAKIGEDQIHGVVERLGKR